MGIENMAFYEIFPPKFANLSVKLTLNFILTTNIICCFIEIHKINYKLFHPSNRAQHEKAHVGIRRKN